MKALTYLSKNCNSLPINGWIHQCIFCMNYTSKIESIYHYKIFSCEKCSKKYDITTKYQFVISNFKDFVKV